MQNKVIIFGLFVLMLVGCSGKQNPIEVDVSVNPLETLIIDNPAPHRAVITRSTMWIVITPDNVDELVTGNVVLFGVVPDDYEDLALNLADLKRYILAQREIIVYYQNTITRLEESFKPKPEKIIEE